MRYILQIVCLCTGILSADEWVPPVNPDPERILRSAESDAVSSRYELAVAKSVWYYRDGLRHDSSIPPQHFTEAWRFCAELVKEYPPAIDALRKMRDSAKASVLSDQHVLFRFADYAAINRELSDQRETVSLFLQLHENDAKRAEAVYRLAQDDLIGDKRYAICIQYVDADKDFQSLVEGYQTKISGLLGASPIATEMRKRRFIHEAGSLIALLAVSGERDAAERLANKAAAVVKESEGRAVFSAAVDGEFPRR
jgi:hypothetical protein